MREAGLTVFETPGWEKRARSSGGFASPPLGIQWHHTAGNTNLQANLDWQTSGCPDAPVGNMLLWFDGTCHMVAAGAANTAGKGGPIKMSRGTVPLDSGNSTTWAIEAGNNGVGQEWPQIQIDAYFTVSNTLNAKFGNVATDLFTHAGYTDASCPGRKIDPATAAAVQGPWKPRSVNSSGTWNQDDVRAEAQRRWAGVTPIPDEEDDMPLSQEDIDKIAHAVWKYNINDPTVSKMIDADLLMGYIRGAASNADRQTRPSDAKNTIAEDVWSHPTRSLT